MSQGLMRRQLYGVANQLLGWRTLLWPGRQTRGGSQPIQPSPSCSFWHAPTSRPDRLDSIGAQLAAASGCRPSNPVTSWGWRAVQRAPVRSSSRARNIPNSTDERVPTRLISPQPSYPIFGKHVFEDRHDRMISSLLPSRSGPRLACGRKTSSGHLMPAQDRAPVTYVTG
jgi:hypothetical protein